MPESTVTITVQKYDRLLRAESIANMFLTLIGDKAKHYGSIAYDEVRFLAKFLGIEGVESDEEI